MKKSTLALSAFLFGAEACQSHEEAASRSDVIVDSARHNIADQATNQVSLGEVREDLERDYSAYERQQRDKLFADLLGGKKWSTSMNSNGVEPKNDDSVGSPFEIDLFGLLELLKPRYSYGVKPALTERVRVDASHYLFDLRSVAWFRDRSLDPYGAYYEIVDKLSISNSPFGEYKEALAHKRTELGLPDLSEDPLRHPDLEPFYETVRSPSEQDLKSLYFLLSRLPKSLFDPLLKIESTEFDAADALIRENPALVPNGEIDSRDRYELTRSENGELVYPIRADGSPVWHVGFSEKLESEISPFVKFLFRRGPAFTHNARILLEAYKSSDSQESFLRAVRLKISQ